MQRERRLTSLYRNQSTWLTDRCKRVRNFSVDPCPSAHDRFARMHIHVHRYTIEMPVTVCHKIQVQASALALSPRESALSLALYLPSGTIHSVVCSVIGSLFALRYNAQCMPTVWNGESHVCLPSEGGDGNKDGRSVVRVHDAHVTMTGNGVEGVCECKWVGLEWPLVMCVCV